MANKLLGQHFLKNPSVVDQIVAAIDIRKGDSIIEIGPGRGALTIPLAKVCDEVGAGLVAIEKDATLAEEMQRIAVEAGIKNLEIIRGDILEFLKIGSRPEFFSSKIVGNIPYYLTGHLLRVISELENRPERCVFMVQKEVAERIVATSPDMNRFAASVQFWAEPRIAVHVSRKDFLPEPKVDSAVIVLEKKSKPVFDDSNRYFAAVRTIFAQPRKTILNNLSVSASHLSKTDLSVGLEKLGIDPKGRPQNLSVPQIAALAQSFF